MTAVTAVRRTQSYVSQQPFALESSEGAWAEPLAGTKHKGVRAPVPGGGFRYNFTNHATRAIR